MRLLNARTKKLCEFTESNTPPYAILSHTWEEGQEISFREVELLLDADAESDKSERKRGLWKIKQTCVQALEENYLYVWIDTCCINKESSSELSEAINSMYRWYKRAGRCYVFLNDVSQGSMKETFAKCRWLTRGWTLQELVAPANVAFFDQDWCFLGDKRTLEEDLVRATRICHDVLRGDMSNICIAQKLSWAASRKTTRIEDQAYCLMGLFGINMPLLYGEGRRAFLRLQEEIIKESDDHSIFAWDMYQQAKALACACNTEIESLERFVFDDDAKEMGLDPTVSGLLVVCPAAFAGCDSWEQITTPARRTPYTVTNRGLSINLEITPWADGIYLACLDVQSKFRLCIFIQRLLEDDQYARVALDGRSMFVDTKRICTVSDRPTRNRQLYVRKVIKAHEISRCKAQNIYGFRLSDDCLRNIPSITSHGSCSGQIMYFPHGHWGQFIHLNYAKHIKGVKYITLGFDFEFNPVCIIEDSATEVTNVATDKKRPTDWTAAFPDNFNWTNMREGKAYRSEEHDGVWALRGHRLYGLDVMISSHPGGAGGVKVQIRRAPEGCSGVWEFSISDLGGVFANPSQKLFRHQWESRSHFQACWGLDMSSEGVDEGNAILEALYDAFAGFKKS